MEHLINYGCCFPTIYDGTFNGKVSISGGHSNLNYYGEIYSGVFNEGIFLSNPVELLGGKFKTIDGIGIKFQLTGTKSSGKNGKEIFEMSNGNLSASFTEMFSDGKFYAIAYGEEGEYIHVHDWDSGIIVQSPTYTKEGLKQYKCSICSSTYTEEIAKLARIDLSKTVVSNIEDQKYTGSEVKPKVIVKDGSKVLQEGIDYELSYQMNIHPGQATVIITGIGNYTGELIETFRIIIHTHTWDNGNVTKNATCTATGVKTYICTECGETKTETIAKTTHTWDNGNVTRKATCTAIGIKTYTCTECGEIRIENIATIAHNYATTTTKATLSKNGSIVKKCTVCGNVKSKTVIAYPKKIKLKTTSYTYNGKAKKPAVIVTDSNGKKISSSNYTVKYNSNKNVGTATATITFKGNYTGTKKLTYKINPKGVSIKKLTKGSKKFEVTWSKNTTQTTGYEVQYSTNKKFSSGNKKVTIKKNKTTSTTIKKLKKNKKYYVKIRTYKTVKGKKYYSGWSKVLNVKTK